MLSSLSIQPPKRERLSSPLSYEPSAAVAALVSDRIVMRIAIVFFMRCFLFVYELITWERRRSW